MKPETSAMMKAARKTQRLAGEWLATFESTGAIDAAKVEAIAKARQKITLAKPANDVEALMMVAAAKTVAAYGHIITQDETELQQEVIEALHSSFTEVAIALQNIRHYLETKTGIDLAAAGLFDELETLQ